MLFAAFLPLLALGALALAPLMEDSSPSGEESENAPDDWNEDGDDGTDEGGDETDEDGADDDTDEDEGELDDDELIEDETPLISISTDGGETLDVLNDVLAVGDNLEAFELADSSEPAIHFVNGFEGRNEDPSTMWADIYGSDQDDVIIVQEGVSDDIDIDPRDGDDHISIQQGQRVLSSEGSDHVVVNTSLDAFENLEGEAENDHFGRSQTTTWLSVSPEDTVDLQLDPEIEGRLIAVGYTEWGESYPYDYEGGGGDIYSTENISVFVIPEEMDIQTVLDGEATLYEGSDDGDDPISSVDGIIQLARISLNDSEDESFDAAAWDGLTSNFEIEFYEATYI
ncbi:hypothetical protein N9O61_04100 [Octadecabacter sp.]|nr:hypothetical protein [Octadecabacter sp.]